MSKTRLLSPFCVLSRNQSSSLFSGLLCRFRYSPVERFFYKFDGIDCCSKLNAKFVNRLIHRCWQLPPPINSVTHCFFDGCYHLIDGDVAVGLCHSLAPLFRSATAETTSLAGSAAAPAARWRKFRRGKFHFEPPSRVTSLDHLVGAREQRWRHIGTHQATGIRPRCSPCPLAKTPDRVRRGGHAS